MLWFIFSDLPETFIKVLYSKLSNDDISAIVRHDELACPSEKKVSVVCLILFLIK